MWLKSKQEEPSLVQQGNWPTSWRNKEKRRKDKWLLAAKAHVASLNFREIGLWVRPSNQAWFEMADTEFDVQQWYENFRVTRDTFELILNEIGREITRRNTPMRKAIRAWRRLAIVLYHLSSTAEYHIPHLYHLCVARTTCLYRRHFCDNYACVMVKKGPGRSVGRHRRAFTWTNLLARCLVYPCRDYLP